MSLSRSLQTYRTRRKISLTVRVSAILVLAVVIPLLITGIGSELILRPTLLSQAATEMGSDAQKHTQAIDSLFIARLEDIEAIVQYAAIQRFLSGDQAFKLQARQELAGGFSLDPNYSTWTLFDTQGKVKLSYPVQPLPRGEYTIAPEIIQQLRGVNKTVISDVYFDGTTNMAFVDIYVSITSTTPNAKSKLLGFGRSTLQLKDIWDAVNNETNAAPGSYAIVLDGHGVRIAYTNPDTTLTTLPPGLFKAIAPLTPQFQQRIKNEDLYGNTLKPVNVLPDPMFASILQNSQETTTFQVVPALQGETFQAYRATSHIIPWTYLVLRPVNTITQAANQQDIYLLLIAAVVSVLAAFVGLVIGRGITRPILLSVSSLLKSSQTLNALASHEQAAATEQKWIVESSEVGLKSVQHYARVTSVAAHKLDEIALDLMQNWERFDASQKGQFLYSIRSTANYIDNASSEQVKSNRSLSTAMRVTAQVTEQLVSGANSAALAATQLEEVIRQLRQVIGE